MTSQSEMTRIKFLASENLCHDDFMKNHQKLESPSSGFSNPSPLSDWKKLLSRNPPLLRSYKSPSSRSLKELFSRFKSSAASKTHSRTPKQTCWENATVSKPLKVRRYLEKTYLRVDYLELGIVDDNDVVQTRRRVSQQTQQRSGLCWWASPTGK